jgi:hypothetical protein
LAALSALVLWADLRSRPRDLQAKRAHAILTQAVIAARLPFVMAGAAALAVLPVAFNLEPGPLPHFLNALSFWAAMIVLLLYERAWVDAGQRLPLS